MKRYANSHIFRALMTVNTAINWTFLSHFWKVRHNPFYFYIFKQNSCQQQLWSWRWWLSFDISFGESLKYRIDYLHCGGWWWPHKIYWSGFVFNNTSLDRIQQLIHISAGKLLLGKWIVNTLGTYTHSFLKRTISPTSWMVQNGWRGQ